jgi:LuxR family transcriptional regulator/LuxR family quorum-sensing system transcriptional regulator CciR
MQHIDTILSRIHTAQSCEELWQILLEYFHSVGAKMASYHATRADGTAMEIKTDGYPETWLCKYINQNLVQIDPIPALAARLATPLYWHDVGDLAPPSKDNKRYLAMLKQAHIGDGVALYVFGPAMQNAYVGLGFGTDRIDLSSETLWAIQCVSQAAHLRACAVHAQTAPPIDLTPREHEVLRWIARGKSNTVIAEILEISPHTVDAHIRRIYAKLNVNDRTSAAILGVGSGLVQMKNL